MVESNTNQQGRVIGDRLVFDDSRPQVDPNFQVRSELLDQLSVGGLTVLTAVHGIGGVGKSQLASKFFRDNQDRFDAAVWVDMSANDGLYDVTTLAGELFGRIDVSKRSVEQQVKSYIASRSDWRWLLVLDDAVTKAHVDRLNPDSVNCQTIVTSRNATLASIGRTVKVDVFSPEMAASYLRQTTGRDDDAGAAGLAGKLGFLPLALRLAGQYCVQEAMTFAEYGDGVLQQSWIDALSPDLDDTAGKDEAIQHILGVSLTAATQRSRLAGPVLETIAALDWKNVSRRWLGSNYPADPEQVDAAVKALAGFSLCELDSGSTEIVHNTIASAAVHLADTERLTETLTDLFSQASVTPAPDKQTAAIWEEPLRHLQRLADQNPHLITERLLPTVNFAAVQLLHKQTPITTFAETSLTQHTSILGETHPDTIRARANLAASYWSVGRYDEAITLQEQVLDEYVEVLGETHPDTIRARANLAASYRSVGRYDEAITLQEQVLDEYVEVLGETHPDTIRARANLAYSYRSVGRYDEAIISEERVLDEYVEVLGETHPDTITARANLAYSYWSVGRYDEAITLQEQVLDERVEVLGETHPDTITARANLATSYRSVGRYDEAITFEEQVLDEYVEVLGETHPDTITARANLAASYWSVGRYDEAIISEERVLDERVEVLGETHPDTITARANLASSYRSVGRYDEALKLLELAALQSKDVLGFEHPDTKAREQVLEDWRSEDP